MSISPNGACEEWTFPYVWKSRHCVCRMLATLREGLLPSCAACELPRSHLLLSWSSYEQLTLCCWETRCCSRGRLVWTSRVLLYVLRISLFDSTAVSSFFCISFHSAFLFLIGQCNGTPYRWTSAGPSADGELSGVILPTCGWPLTWRNWSDATGDLIKCSSSFPPLAQAVLMMSLQLRVDGPS